MNTLKNIEERIKFKNIIIKFKKYINNLDVDDRARSEKLSFPTSLRT
jgi:hypothetical protein